MFDWKGYKTPFCRHGHIYILGCRAQHKKQLGWCCLPDEIASYFFKKLLPIACSQTLFWFQSKSGKSLTYTLIPWIVQLLCCSSVYFLQILTLNRYDATPFTFLNCFIPTKMGFQVHHQGAYNPWPANFYLTLNIWSFFLICSFIIVIVDCSLYLIVWSLVKKQKPSYIQP